MKTLANVTLAAVLFLSFTTVYSANGGPKEPKKSKEITAQNAEKNSRSELNFYIAMEYFTFGKYEEALPIFLQLLNFNDNSNLNFYVGVCYMNLTESGEKALPYLEKAVESTIDDYYATYEETNAPSFAYYYLAMVYHNLSKFDNAIVYYNEFKKHVPARKKALNEDVSTKIESCTNATWMALNEDKY